MRGRRFSAPRPSMLCCLLGAVALFFTSGCTTPLTGSETLYHCDPSTAQERYESWLMFAHLGGALLSVAGQDFDSAEEQLEAIEVARAHLPPVMVQTAQRYLELCQQLTDTIQELFDSLQAAESLLAANDLPRGGETLARCRKLLDDAQQSLDVLEDATAEAFTLLRRSGGGTVTQLNEARSALDEALAMLLRLTEDYERRLAKVEDEIEVIQRLRQPSISAHLDRDSAWVGEALIVSGTLDLDGEPLPDRRLTVLLDDAEAGEVRTDNGGSFVYRLTLPFEYVPSRIVRIAFSPEGDDLRRLLPVTSEVMVVTVRFHESVITMEAPSRWYPGYPVQLVGTVVSTGNVERRPVGIYWHGEPIGNTITGSEGGFSCSVSLPPTTETGDGSLAVQVAGDDSSTTAPGSLRRVIEVTRVAPQLDVRITPLVTVPSLSASLPRQLLKGAVSLSIPIECRVGSPLPLGIVSMVGEWEGQRVDWQQQEELFVQDIPLHISIWAMGARTVVVRAIPREPWHQPVEASAMLLLINLFVPVAWLVAVAAALALAVVFRRARRAAAEKVQVLDVPSGKPVTTGPGGIAASFTGHSGPRLMLLRLYYRAVAWLQAGLGITLRPEMTLREFLASVDRIRPGGLDAFVRLTSLGERALYAGREPLEDDLRCGAESLESLYQAAERTHVDEERRQ